MLFCFSGQTKQICLVIFCDESTVRSNCFRFYLTFSNFKTTMEILSNFVAFSEYQALFECGYEEIQFMNFTELKCYFKECFGPTCIQLTIMGQGHDLSKHIIPSLVFHFCLLVICGLLSEIMTYHLFRLVCIIHLVIQFEACT